MDCSNFLALMAVLPWVSGNCDLSPPTFHVSRGQVNGTTCEDLSRSAVTTTQCVMLCLTQQNCSVVNVECSAGSCHCVLCQGVYDIDFEVTSMEVYLKGSVIETNLTIPPKHEIPLPLSLSAGQVIRILLNLASKKVVIKLRLESGFSLLIDIRMLSKLIVRNSLLIGRWGDEEKDIPYFDFTGNQEVEVFIILRPLEFLVFFDSVPFFPFRHREPDLSLIKHFVINGDGESGSMKSLFISTLGDTERSISQTSQP